MRIEVCDAGRGIPDNEIGLVTGKFFRGRESGSGGSGLGLSIAQRIVRDHAGTLSIESRPGGGTTVCPERAPTMKKRILIVEDDAPLARILADNLAFEGFDVRRVADGHIAMNAASTFAPDLVVLDINLPGLNGFELCRIWREDLRIPIIVLTARVQKEDKLKGLRLGADDYVTKPFDLEELMARVHAVLRRARPTIDQLTLGNVTIDFVRKEAWNQSSAIELTQREFSLLRYLAERANSIVHRDELLHELWHFPESSHTRAVDHAIVRLRRKIEPDPHHPRFIRTAHGGGYLLTATGAEKMNAAGDD